MIEVGGLEIPCAEAVVRGNSLDGKTIRCEIFRETIPRYSPLKDFAA